MTAAPYYEDDQVVIYLGDCRNVLPLLGKVSAVVTDPPYGDTSLDWDRLVEEWIAPMDVEPSGSVWCFGSLRFWMTAGSTAFHRAGYRYAQEIVWEKHNGSSFHADRFKRVHEFAVQWYRGQWSNVFKSVPVTMDATPRAVRHKERPPHTGHIEASSYLSEDGGPRLMRSVLQVRSEHGRAVHPTQKPVGIIRPLVQNACRPEGIVLDPFMGSGITLVAARELGRRAIGIEVNEAYCEAAAKRFDQLTLEVA